MQSVFIQKPKTGKNHSDSSGRASQKKQKPFAENVTKSGMPVYLQCKSTDSALLDNESEQEAVESSINVQPKLTIGAADDPYEKEADAVADKVMRMPVGGGQEEYQKEVPSIQSKPFAVSPIQRMRSDWEKGLNSSTPVIQKKPNHSFDHGQSSTPDSVMSTIESPGSGSPLSESIRARVEPVLGADLSSVRVHTDSRSQLASRNIQAKAFTHGKNIFLGAGQSHHDVALMAHEATHTVQQSGASTHIQRFEAGLHEAAEMQGLTGRGGLTREEANAAYFGNWMRDVNQAFVPALEAFGMPPDATFAALSYMAAMKFGRTISPQQLGYYIAAEHLDNPAGLLPADQEVTDIYPQHPVTGGGPANPVVNPDVPAALNAQQDTGARATVGGMGVLQVDRHGVMGFIHRSVELVEQRMQLAVSRGRNPDGLAHLGAGLHTVEDLFAHSNWVEIAVQSRLRAAAATPTPAGWLAGDREPDVFNYAPDLSVGSTERRRSRPVLTTGTFSGTDTQVSLGSELVAILRRPLTPPGTSAQSEEAERFTAAMLDTFSARLEADDGLRQRIRDGLTQREMPGLAADALLRLPLGEVYRWTRIPLPGVPDSWRIWVGTQIHAAMSQLVLQPLADRIAGEALDARAADTPQLTVLRASRATEADAGQSTAERRTARRRASQLGDSPVAAVAGPSHSQLAKDHTNSPFFGLAFALASEAVRRIRVEVMTAWGATTAFVFSHGSFPTSLPVGADADDQAERRHQSALFHEGRTERGTQLHATAQRGRRILNRGGEGAAYDLAAIRRADATQIRATARVFDTIGATPAWASQALVRLNSMVAQLGDERLARAEGALRQAASVASGIDSDARTAAIRTAGVALAATANLVEAAQTRVQRADAQQAMDTAYTDVLSALGMLSGNTRLRSIILSTVDRQRSLLDPAYSHEQRALLERIDTSGRLRGQAPAGLESAPALREGTYTAPALTGAAADDVIDEVRNIMGHPYDSDWWHSLVDNYMQEHADRLAVDIEARNEGIAFLRRPGESDHAGHQH